MTHKIDFRLDTDPMAHQIEKMKNHVDGTTTAVIAMQVAVIKAESEAADYVCANVNKGFHTLIRSQISQKIARLQSEIDAKILELNQQSIALSNIKNRMARDYNMISRRYSKLFNTLNASLKQRIFELDKQVVSFVNNDIEIQTKRVKQLLGTVPVNQSESVLLSQSLLSSTTKQNGVKLINSMSKFIQNVHYQEYLTRSVVFRKSIQNQQDYYLPVIISSSESDNISNVKYSQSINTFSNITSIIDNRLRRNSDSLRWKATNRDEQMRITNEFKNMVMDCSDSDRVKKTMISLFNKAGVINQLME